MRITRVLRPAAIFFGASAYSLAGAAAAPTAASSLAPSSATVTKVAPAAPASPPTPPKATPPPAAKKSTTAKPSKAAQAAKPPAKAGQQDVSARRQVASGSTYDDAALGAESNELRALYQAERELFPPAMQPLGSPWPSEVGQPVFAAEERPRVHASGLPPRPAPNPTPVAEGGKDISWLQNLEMPELPVRWDARVVRYLEFFKDDPRGRAMLSIWFKRSGRYKEMIKKTFKRKGLPEDLMWLAMIESGFDPGARSPVGAVGLWQFMPETGRLYGLSIDRWTDMRQHLMLSTEAASDFLADLHRRFGSWELAMAAYNMGYGGVLAVVRRYNTNDYWALSKLEGSLPWETTLYVPKIIAASIVARNLSTFGFQELQPEAAIEGEEMPVPPSTMLGAIAQACGVTQKEIEMLNPELRAQRTPPADPSNTATSRDEYPLRVPMGKASTCSANLAKHRGASTMERYVVKFGETLEQIATAHKVTTQRLVEVNSISPGEVVRGGAILLIPKGGVAGGEEPDMANDKPVVVVPSDVFVYPDRKRVFYRVLTGDTLRDIGVALNVSVDDIRMWNGIDPAARLQEGMTLQLFVPADADLTKASVLSENKVRVITAGTDEFFAYWDDKGRKRITLSAKSGDTLESIGKKYGVSGPQMERINRRGAKETLKEGETVVLYTQQSAAAPPSKVARENAAPEPLPPLVKSTASPPTPPPESTESDQNL